MRWLAHTALPFILLIVIGVGWLYAPELSGRVLYCCDNLTLTIPAKTFWADWYRVGITPLWNPLLLSGTPYLADLNLSPLYAGNALYLFLPPFRALTWLVVFHALLGSIGMYALARQNGLTRWGSMMAGLLFGGSGTVATYSGNVPMAQVAGWIPWVLWAWRREAEIPGRQSLLLAALLTAMLGLAGHPQLVAYGLLLALLYRLAGPGNIRHSLPALLRPLAIAAALLAVQWFPFLEFARLSTRMLFGNEYTGFGAQTPAGLVRLLFPALTGSSAAGTAIWQGGSVYGYIGTVSVLAAILGFRRGRQTNFWLVVAIGSLLLACGQHTPVYPLVARVVPGLGNFRVPAHFLLTYTIAVVLLAAHGYEQLMGSLQREKKSALPFYIGLAWVGGGSILLLLRSRIPVLFNSLDAFPDRLTGKLTLMGAAGARLLMTDVAVSLLLTGGILLVFSRLLRRGHTGWLTALLPVLVLSELIPFSRSVILSVPETAVSAWMNTGRETAAQLRQYTGGQRLYVDPALDANPRQVAYGTGGLPTETQWQIAMSRPNLGTMYGIPQVQGYAAMVYAPYQRSFGLAPTDPTGVTIDPHDRTRIGKAAGLVLLRRSTGECGWQPGISPPLSCQQVELNPLAVPRLRFTGVNETTPRFTELPGLLVVQTRASQPNTLEFRETAYPGWRAFIDGSQVPVGQLETVFQRIDIPAGNHTVVLVFSPDTVFIGWLLSVTGLVTVWWLWWRASAAAKSTQSRADSANIAAESGRETRSAGKRTPGAGRKYTRPVLRR